MSKLHYSAGPLFEDLYTGNYLITKFPDLWDINVN
jgi:hypothetical protein